MVIITKIKNIFFVLTIISVQIGLNSCCKDQISASLEVKFENFDFTKMDSVMLIETNRENINQQRDTIFYNLTENHSLYIPVFDNDIDNGNFIIKHSSPSFEHHITELNAERTNSFGCAGGKIKFSFKLDEEEYKKEKNIV